MDARGKNNDETKFKTITLYYTQVIRMKKYEINVHLYLNHSIQLEVILNPIK